MFSTLLQKLKDILDANDLIQEVFNYDVEQFQGIPAVTITPSSNESDYNTTEENVRIYAYNVRVFVTRTTLTKKKADEALRGLVDSIIDDFDKYYTLSAIGTDGSAIPGGAISNPTGYTFINLFATPSLWGYIGEREDEYRVAEIEIRCRVSVDLSSIS